MTKKRKAILFFTGFAIAVIACLWLGSNRQDIQYEVFYPPGFSLPLSEPFILGEQGEIIGSSFENRDIAFFIWDRTKGNTMVPRPGFETSQEPGEWIPVDVNTHGDITGYRKIKRHWEAFVWTADKGFTLLGDFGGDWSCPRNINNNSMIAGLAKTVDDKGHAFVWEKGKGMTDLTPDAMSSFAYGLNNHGQVVGEMETPEGTRAFLWEESTGVTELSLPGASEAGALAINDSGQIIGVYDDRSGNYGLFTWDRRTTIKQFKFDGMNHRINNAGCIVFTTQNEGISFGKYTLVDPKLEPYIGSIEGGFIRLHTLLPEEVQDFYVMDMNDRGEMLIINDYFTQAQLALLRPIREPK